METNTLLMIALLFVLIVVVFQVLSTLTFTSIYRLAGPLFTPSERDFYSALVHAIGDQYLVFGKVRVADLVTVKRGNNAKSSRTALNRIAQKHVDFVLCSKVDLTPICVIELNDRSHDKRDRKDRDVFLKKVFGKLKMPMVWIPASNRYDSQMLRAAIMEGITPADTTKTRQP